MKLVQVIHVTGPESVDEALAARRSSIRCCSIPAIRGSRSRNWAAPGRVHDWTHSRRICEASAIPVLLAGGLNPGNARAALEQVRPAGLDVCSGLRLNGRLDGGLLHAFFHAIH